MTAYVLPQLQVSQKIFWRTPASVLVTFGMPLVMGGLMPLMMPSGAWGGATLDVYLVTGAIALIAVITGFMNLLEVLVARRQALILKRLRGTELPDLAIFAGEILNAVVIGTLQLVLLVGTGTVLHGIPLPANPLLLVVTMLAGLMVFAALAVALSGRVAAQGSTIVVSMPVLFVAIACSGLAFPVSQFPEWAQSVARFIPMTPVADGIRTAYVGRDFVNLSGSLVPPEVGLAESFQVMAPGGLVVAVWLVVALWGGKRWFKWEPRRG